MFEHERKHLVDNLIREGYIKSEGVKKAFLEVPRDEFIPDTSKIRAYIDTPLEIGYGQTISQPYIVALMTEALQLSENQKVLEIGTGSGYQAAILAEMGMDVYSIEIIPELEVSAKSLLRSLDYDNVHTRN